MTQRQLAEKYDGPGCSDISPFYEWLPLLLLTQLHGQLLQRMSRILLLLRKDNVKCWNKAKRHAANLVELGECPRVAVRLCDVVLE